MSKDLQSLAKNHADHLVDVARDNGLRPTPEFVEMIVLWVLSGTTPANIDDYIGAQAKQIHDSGRDNFMSIPAIVLGLKTGLSEEVLTAGTSSRLEGIQRIYYGSVDSMIGAQR